jgi:hypothetical protein
MLAPMEGRRGGPLKRAACLVGVAALVGCGSTSKPKSGITIDTLAAASGTACAVPLEVAADNSGIDTPLPAAGSVVVGHPATDPTMDGGSESPIDAADGVEVGCTLTLDDGTTLSLLLVAARTDAAPELLVPAAAAAGGLTQDQATQLANDVTRTEEGDLIPVPGSNAVAVMRTKVDGATSAAFLVSSKSLKRPQVEQVARQLDERLR